MNGYGRAFTTKTRRLEDHEVEPWELSQYKKTKRCIFVPFVSSWLIPGLALAQPTEDPAVELKSFKHPAIASSVAAEPPAFRKSDPRIPTLEERWIRVKIHDTFAADGSPNAEAETMSARATRRKRTSPGSYFTLIHRFPPRPIRSERELDRTAAVIDGILARPRLSRDEQDYLDVLSGLVEQYEEEKHPIPPAPDADVLAFLIEQKGVTQAEVARAAGLPTSTLSEILSGRRTIPRFKIGRLAAYFRVSPVVFAFEK